MLNTSNLCIFEGRITSDPEFTTMQGKNGSFERVSFSMAIDKNNISAQDRQAARNGDKSIQTSDFIRCSGVGSTATFVKNYCPKGKAVKVVCTYTTYQTTNNQTGQTQYGHSFSIEGIGFTVPDAKNMVSNNNQQNGFQQQQQFNGQQQFGGQQQFQSQNFMNQPQQNPNSNFSMFEGNSMFQ